MCNESLAGLASWEKEDLNLEELSRALHAGDISQSGTAHRMSNVLCTDSLHDLETQSALCKPTDQLSMHTHCRDTLAARDGTLHPVRT